MGRPEDVKLTLIGITITVKDNHMFTMALKEKFRQVAFLHGLVAGEIQRRARNEQ